MAPENSPLTLALRTPLRMAATLVALLVVAGSAAAQLPALPSTDDIPLESGLDATAGSPVGGIDAASYDESAQVCADSYTSSDQVTSLAPALPAAPVPVPSYGVPSADLSSGLSGCTDVDAGQTIDDAVHQAEDAKDQTKGFLGEVKSFFDDMWDQIFGAI